MRKAIKKGTKVLVGRTKEIGTVLGSVILTGNAEGIEERLHEVLVERTYKSGFKSKHKIYASYVTEVSNG